MTVQEVIDVLSQVKDKTLPVGYVLNLQEHDEQVQITEATKFQEFDAVFKQEGQPDKPSKMIVIL